MNKIAIILLVLLGCTRSNITDTSINIIPHPLDITKGENHFVLNSRTKIISGHETEKEADYLASILRNAFGKEPGIETKVKKGIHLKLNTEIADITGDEGYILTTSRKNISIESATTAGIFYGIQSLRQLLPPDFEYNPDIKKSATINEIKITDRPEFPWRAFMLDESRYFKGMETVKKLLDQMALLKMNIFHWHLTDDQGWRIEIKKYPKLTEVGAYRKNSQIGGWGSKERSNKPHGGFYTQNQIKEIVNYATKLHIKIIPEIEMPGHSIVAIAAYPWLGTTGNKTEVPVVFGKMSDCLNVANPKVIDFIENVLSEVIELFPAKIIHIGGDEVKFDAWKNSKMVQDYMKKESLSSPADLQIFFTNRISNFIASKDYRMMGWNDILGGNVHEWQKAADVKVEQSLAKSTIIHFWKGNIDLASQAVSNGFDIINSHHIYTYLDYDYKSISLKKAYSFSPIPEGLDEKYHSNVLGLGCQMWGEWIPEISDMEKQVFPRIAAYAEVGWTTPSQKNFEDFKLSLEDMKKRWDLERIAYYGRLEE